MTQTSAVSLFRFSTLAVPERDRFGTWVSENHCDCRLLDAGSTTFDSESAGAALGPFILSGRKWLNPVRTATYALHRTERHIRTDGYDYFFINRRLSGRLCPRSTSEQPVKTAGDLYLLDAAQVNECVIETGDSVSLVIPRDYLPNHAARLHGRALSSGIAHLLGDHMLSLYQRLAELQTQDVPHVVQATLQLVTAAIAPTRDAVWEACDPIRDALINRIHRHIDARLLEVDLTPDRICRDIGVSRAKLYQLFEGEGGVMRLIQRKRLRRAYRVLSDPNRVPVRIKEIAWHHGFQDEKHFYRLFKTEFGHTPSETVESTLDVRNSRGGGAEYSLERGAHPVGWSLPYGVFK
ncbi:helix-turn-helix domain-containing protein [Paraburkholderia sp. J12]|uniref:helix-turn-helix domain-containing protein n=1 Tax=Paraburkholderia sp. J12 TaxID=2805432 RepID=UPI002ABD6B08|nr:helix-turn-helix domain-containing protein [Paraburkholderia sp. J12]